MVHPRRCEVFAYGLQGTAEDFGDPAGVRWKRRWRGADSRKIKIGGRRHRPKVEQWLNARHSSGTGLEIRHKGRGGLVEMLSESFVVSESKRFVLSNRPAERSSKLIPLKRRRISPIE